ncbi:threonine synthase [Kiritimatiella glycovorans]|uniref:Threonine synthase n=1 Tax=Kiritimatiella glycovorans TaxID=1307763 RepID=A0A0G3EH09_9BACT|nr:threonine synthase [Kiritimatiella glycovorans]AKJ64095.1 Threonine synthase [Kiritimatiella glycovorans]
MNYLSTRGGMAPVGFGDAVLMGLASDGGLLLPEAIPEVRDRLEAWRGLDYASLAFEVMRLFADVPDDDLRRMVDRSYAVFRDPEVAPVKPVGPLWIMELFHGPTLAFKDVALQFLGHLFEYLLEQRGGRLNILGATSGDTGSAAIYGVRGKKDIRIFIMHPRGRVSPVQERQMTSVLDGNVFNLAVEGSFDDCQHILKSIFGDVEFKQRHALGAVNSVNWARVMAQIVYYFYGAFRVMDSTGAGRVRFSVPTGNFGDILAGYLAWKMGLPVDRLVLATNENDILAQFFTRGVYRRGEVHATLSPSMDIQVASNFERYLYYRSGEDPRKVRHLMETFRRTGGISVAADASGRIDPVFAAGRGSRELTLAVIRRYREDYDYLADPHTAVGIGVAEDFCDPEAPMICLATAHPAKFPDAIREATGEEAQHAILDRCLNAETRTERMPADEQAVRAFIADHALEAGSETESE